jgi:hypothetical protein
VVSEKGAPGKAAALVVNEKGAPRAEEKADAVREQRAPANAAKRERPRVDCRKVWSSCRMKRSMRLWLNYRSLRN